MLGSGQTCLLALQFIAMVIWLIHCYEIMVIILIWAANENCAGQGLKARWLTTPFLHKHTPTCL